MMGNCFRGYVVLRQPILTNDCIKNQSDTCGQYTGSMLVPCKTTSLAVAVTQNMNGTIIQSQNLYATSTNTELLGNTSIVVSGGKCTHYRILVKRSKS